MKSGTYPSAAGSPHSPRLLQNLEFQRDHLSADGQGTLWIAPDPATPSNRLCAAAAANALFLVNEGEQRLSEGDLVEVIPLRGFGL